ncbi:hypothetical protein G6514_010239 [Epicoccum nigrum]|nr:hypothetical protein G6514_010239 [Epicoccum nigrum]
MLAERDAQIVEQDILIAWQKTKVLEQCAFIAGQKTNVLEQDTLRDTVVSQRDTEVAELKKQLKLERKQNLENTQLIEIMMDNGYPPPPPTPTAEECPQKQPHHSFSLDKLGPKTPQVDAEAVAELNQQLQYSKNLVQHLTEVVIANRTKLSERDARIAEQSTKIAEQDDLIADQEDRVSELAAVPLL